MSVKIKLLVAVMFFFAAKPSADAQRIALTSNLVDDILLTPNIGVDIVVADRQSLTFDASCAPYKLSQKFYNKCMTIKAGYKYWFNQAFYAHYIGVDAVLSSTDMRIGRAYMRDEYIGLGIGYGYSFIIGRRLNIVPSIGVGVAYGQSYDGYDQMIKPGVGEQAVATPGVKPIMTRLAVTLQYVLK